MRQIVLFGTGEIAELADFYFSHDSEYDVVGFTVDEAYLKDSKFRGRPVVPFERLAETFPPQDYGLFVAVSYSRINDLRAAKVAAAREAGYRLVSYVSSRATVFRGPADQRELLHPRGQYHSALCANRSQRHAVERQSYWASLGHRGRCLYGLSHRGLRRSQDRSGQLRRRERRPCAITSRSGRSA